MSPEDRDPTSPQLQPQPRVEISAFKEKPWEVLVGDRACVVYAHPSVLARRSIVLKARVTGPWSTNTKNVLDWTRFDELTIACVLNFFYAGQYGFTSPTSPTEAISDERQAIVQHAAYHSSKRSDYNPLRLGPPTQGPTETVPDLGDLILLHAKVHAFAHEYLCPDLLDYCLAQLSTCFQQTERVSVEILPKVADAVKEIYLNTPSSETKASLACQEITKFVIANHTKLIAGDGVDVLSDLGVAFTGDLIRGLSQTLTAEKEKIYGRRYS